MTRHHPLKPFLSIPTLLTVLLVPACTDSTGPEEDIQAAPERVQEMASYLDSIAAAELDLIEAVRAEVEQALGLSLESNPAGNDFPAAFKGRVIVRNPSTHVYEVDETATGAPANGVRVMRYHRSGGSLVVPLAANGHVDFTDEDTGSEAAMGIHAVRDGADLFDLVERGYATRTRYQFDPPFQLEGTIGADRQLFLLIIGSDHSRLDYGNFDNRMGGLRVAMEAFGEFGGEGRMQLASQVGGHDTGLPFGALDLYITIGSEFGEGYGHMQGHAANGGGSYSVQFDVRGTLPSLSLETGSETPLPTAFGQNVGALAAGVLQKIQELGDMFVEVVDPQQGQAP